MKNHDCKSTQTRLWPGSFKGGRTDCRLEKYLEMQDFQISTEYTWRLFCRVSHSFFGTTNVGCVLHSPENFVLATAVAFRYRSPSGNSGLFNLWKNVPGDPLLFFETCCDPATTVQEIWKSVLNTKRCAKIFSEQF